MIRVNFNLFFAFSAFYLRIMGMQWLASMKKLSFCTMIGSLSILTVMFGLVSMVILQHRTISLLQSRCDIETLTPKKASSALYRLEMEKSANMTANVYTNPSSYLGGKDFDFSVTVGASGASAASRSTDTRLIAKCHHAPTEIKGVAFTLFLGSPKWFQNRYSMMINLLHGALPKDWVIQIFYLPKNKMSNEAVNHPGIQKQVKKGNVILVPIPDGYAKLRKRELMLLPWLWKQLVAEKVLTFGGTNVLCSNSPLNLDDDFGHYDFIGSPSRDLKGLGGDGGLSLRNRTSILTVLRDNNDAQNARGNDEASIFLRFMLNSQKSSSYLLGSPSDTTAFALNDATQSFDVDWNPETVQKLAFGVLPLGAQGTLAGLGDAQRTKALEFCPELKMFFPSLHSGACFGASPRPLECFKFLCENGGLRCDEDAALDGGIEYEVNKKSNPGVKGKLLIKLGV